MKTKVGVLLMIASSVCACLGQLFWKMAAGNTDVLILLFGFVLYGLGALLMIIAYRFGKLSVLQPILASNYVLSIVLGALILNEQVTLFKCVGIMLIITGVFCIATGDKEQ